MCPIGDSVALLQLGFVAVEKDEASFRYGGVKGTAAGRGGWEPGIMMGIAPMYIAYRLGQ